MALDVLADDHFRRGLLTVDLVHVARNIHVSLILRIVESCTNIKYQPHLSRQACTKASEGDWRPELLGASREEEVDFRSTVGGDYSSTLHGSFRRTYAYGSFNFHERKLKLTSSTFCLN